jgi:limonene-1,2-epoxide hydrolase
MSDAASVVRQFLQLLEQGDAPGALALLGDDIVWRNTGMPTMRGRRVTGALLDMERRGIGFRVRMHHLAADGPIVLTERTDVLAYGRFETAFWVCGTFEVHDGLIVLWDDHFSWGNLAASSLRGLGRAVLPRS